MSNQTEDPKLPRHKWGRSNMGGEQRCDCGVMRSFVNRNAVYLSPEDGQNWQYSYVPCKRKPK